MVVYARTIAKHLDHYTQLQHIRLLVAGCGSGCWLHREYRIFVWVKCNLNDHRMHSSCSEAIGSVRQATFTPNGGLFCFVSAIRFGTSLFSARNFRWRLIKVVCFIIDGWILCKSNFEYQKLASLTHSLWMWPCCRVFETRSGRA